MGGIVEVSKQVDGPANDQASTTSLMGAVSGAVAAGVALAVGELVAAIATWQSPVINIDNRVIDLSPGSAARQGIETFGHADKPALIIGTVVLSLAIGAALGSATTRRRWVGPAGFAAFGLLGAWAGAADPLSSASGAFVSALVAAGVGIAVLLTLLRVAASPPRFRTTGRAPTRVVEDPRAPAATRRSFFVWAGAAGAFAVGAAGLARGLKGPSAAETARANVQLPPGPKLPSGLETEVPGLTPLVTPNKDFYRIDTALLTPQVDPKDWQLRLNGMVDHPYELSYQELLDLATEDADVTLCCVSNEVGGDLVSTARWRGVPLWKLLDRAGVQQRAEQVVGRSVDNFTAGFPIEAVRDGRPAFVAVAMNGEPLPLAHGFPARLVVAGLYGYVSATKWLTEIHLTTWDGFDGYWIPRGWAKRGPIKTEARIDVPQGGAHVSSGRQPIAGVAWAGQRGIEKVEVRVDDGPWRSTRLGPALAETTWRQWVLEWDATPGDHTIVVRATDGTGTTQTEVPAPPAPDGASGWPTIGVTVDG